jgi:hypothetical protein
MRDSYEIFKNTYVNDKQVYLEQVFNVLAKLRGATVELQIIPVEPIGMEFSENAILQVAPKEWILEKLGIDMTKYQPITEPAVAPALMKAKFTEDEVLSIFAEFGEDKNDYTILQSRHVFGDVPSDEEEAMNFEFAAIELTKLEANILDLIQKDKRVTPEVLASTTKTDLIIIKKVLDGLATKGFINTKTVGTTIERSLPKPLSELPAPTPDTKTYMMRYSYEWRNNIPVGQRNTPEHPSRPFCARLMQLDRVYSRAEIEAISQRLGYSVFDRRGGWWTEPSGKHSPSCRHIWKSQIVVKKG